MVKRCVMPKKGNIKKHGRQVYFFKNGNIKKSSKNHLGPTKLQQTNPGIPWFDWWWSSCLLPRWVWRRTTHPGSRCPRPPSHPSRRPRWRRPRLWSRSPCPGRTLGGPTNGQTHVVFLNMFSIYNVVYNMEDMRRTGWWLPPSEYC